MSIISEYEENSTQIISELGNLYAPFNVLGGGLQSFFPNNLRQFQ
jgi:hypothetical protein